VTLYQCVTRVFVGLFIASCKSTEPDPSPIVFTVSSQLEGTVGQAFLHSFCKPELSGNATLCLGTATNPTGGQPPYHFQLDTGIGFPPIGLSLGLNGILNGTPSITGTSVFSVCAVDVAGQSACSTVTMTVLGTVTVGQVGYSCTISASPLPGWKNCTGTVGLTISKTIQSGYVSVFFNYPTSGAFFHGELAVNSGGPAQTITINVVNQYVSHCVPTYLTSVDVYDGRQNAGQAPLLVSQPVTLSSNCP